MSKETPSKGATIGLTIEGVDFNFEFDGNRWFDRDGYPGGAIQTLIGFAWTVDRERSDHAAAVARLESRLSLAEKVVEAAELVRNIVNGCVMTMTTIGQAEAELENALAAYRSVR